MSYLPTQEAVYVPAARLYARKLNEARPADFGLTRSYEFVPSVEEAELSNNNDGIDGVFMTRAKKVSGTVNIEIDLFTGRNIAMWAYGEEVFHTQTASTGLVVDEDDVIAGQATKLNGLNVTNLELTAGATVLVEGVHYSLNAKMGLIRWLQSFANVSGTYARPVIVANDAKSVINVLSASGGIEVILTVEGTSDVGQQVLIQDQRVRLRPASGMAAISQDADFGTLSFEGTLIKNALSPATPYGTITLV